MRSLTAVPDARCSPAYAASLGDKCLAKIRSAMPGPLRAAVREGRALLWRTLHRNSGNGAIEDRLPWTSPNVWNKIVASYARRDAPVVCEYGIGASTLHHVRQLMPLGGTYIGIEHDPAWYAATLGGLLQIGLQEGMTVRLEGRVADTSPALRARETELALHGTGDTRCKLILKLRHYPACADPHGAPFEEMPEYVRALREACDVVIVDGVARKGCINHVLDTTHLREGGVLVLHDAGHGLEDWLGRPSLTGARDFRPEVQRMMDEGGEIAHGTGIDSWLGQTGRRAIGPEAFHYPVEACFMTRRSSPREERSTR